MMLVLGIGPKPWPPCPPNPGVVGASWDCGPSDSRPLFLHTQDAITLTLCFSISVSRKKKRYFTSHPGNNGWLSVLNNFNTVPDLPYNGSNSKPLSYVWLFPWFSVVIFDRIMFGWLNLTKISLAGAAPSFLIVRTDSKIWPWSRRMSDSFVCVLLLLLLLFVCDEVVRGSGWEGNRDEDDGGVGGEGGRDRGQFRPWRERVSRGWAGTISKHRDLSSPLWRPGSRSRRWRMRQKRCSRKRRWRWKEGRGRWRRRRRGRRIGK